MLLYTNFVAYDVYRATCTRCGFIDASSPNSSLGNTSRTLRYGRDNALYMEFGEPVRTQHGLPDGTPLEGCAVEIHIHFFARSNSYGSAKDSASTFNIELCERRIAADKDITFFTKPKSWYSRVEEDPLNYAFSGYTVRGNDIKHGENEWLSNDKIYNVMLVSHKRYSPIDVFEAVHDSALLLERVFDPTSAVVYASGSYTPYVEIICGTIAPEPYITDWGKLHYVNPYELPTLRWHLAPNDQDAGYVVNNHDGPIASRWIVGGSIKQENATVSIRENESAEFQQYAVQSDAPSWLISQNVCDMGNFECYVRVESIQGDFGDTNTVAFTTIDANPTTIIISPKNAYISISDAAVFRWDHVISTGTAQSKYEISVLAGGEWQVLQEAEGSAEQATVPAELLTSQMTAWRVRTANADGVYGEYSEPANVVFIVPPRVDAVTAEGNVRPTVRCQSGDQQGYDVMVDGETTGTRYGTGKSYTWHELLTDGAHTIRVRVVNRFGLASAWAEVTHIVKNAPGESRPALQAVSPDGIDVALSWIGDGQETHVYRDGARIAVLAGKTAYTDHTATGRHRYTVRVVRADGSYADSESAVVTLRLRRAYIAAEGAWDWVALTWGVGENVPARDVTSAPVYALKYYSGREYPAVEMSAHRSRTYTVAYALDDPAALDRLHAMLGKLVVHKRDGELMRGLLTGVGEARKWWGAEVSLTLVEVSDK